MLKANEVGGGTVRRTFYTGTKRLYSGDVLTPEDIKAMPTANYRALVNTEHITVWPKHDGVTTMEPDEDVVNDVVISADSADIPRHVISRGGGRYDVIEGRKLNDKHLNKYEAHKLAEQ